MSSGLTFSTWLYGSVARLCCASRTACPVGALLVLVAVWLLHPGRARSSVTPNGNINTYPKCRVGGSHASVGDSSRFSHASPCPAYNHCFIRQRPTEF